MTQLFFLSNERSVIEVPQTLDYFLLFAALKQNKSKCETASIGVIKWSKWRSVVWKVLI